MSVKGQMGSIGGKSIAAVFWGAGGTVLKMLLQLGTQILLARLLGPSEYGVFAIGAIIIGFSGFLSDVGIAYGLIQKEEVEEEDVRFVMAWQLLLGVGISLAVYVLAEPLAGFFGEPRAGRVIEAMSILCLLNAMAAPSLNLLKRHLDFRQIQLAQIGSYLLGYVVVGLPLAAAGWGVWALVWAWIVQATASGLWMYAKVRHPLLPLWWHEGALAQLRYGATVLMTNLVNWTINNVDRVIVGRAFNSKETGLYATSVNLLYAPSTALLGVIQPVFFSASSRIAGETDRVERAYRALLATVVTLLLPAFVFVAVFSPQLIQLLYGDAWKGAGEILRPVALSMPLLILWGLTTPMLWTRGHASSEFRILGPMAALWVGVTAVAASQGLVAVAWSVLALNFSRALIGVLVAARLLRMSTRLLWRSIRGGVVFTAVLALLWCFWAQVSAPALVVLGGAAVLGALFGVVLIRVFPSLLAEDLANLLGKVLDRLPKPVRRLLAVAFGPVRERHDG